MKSKITHIKYITIACFLVVFPDLNVFSQGTDLNSHAKQNFFFGFNICPSRTSITNKGIASLSSLSSTGKNSLSGNIEIGYNFSRMFGLSTGFGFSSYRSKVNLNLYNINYDTIDSDTPQENYTRYITGQNINELQNISLLNIPIALNFLLPVSDIFNVYIQTGLNFSFPVKSNFTSSGTFTYEGYYPAYNIRITDIPFEGFEQDYPNNSKGELTVKSFNTELITSAGCSIKMNHKMQILLGLTYNKMFSDLSDYKPNDNFTLSTRAGQLRSIMQGSPKVSASSVGARLGLRLYLK